ncbi:hypothetical protein K469DRAFT_684000 [Zopfia rhizophila CBS 207.26]|uniref:Uncharacterized protein n=1 Tax=Zopfia rhizophila CBS 207.26 TaxID=1314779 RepID=A0A6A6DCD3_9PEZI|nr:hypothetical protein K469DRAFT_684000 [Zopfia rhizophila CBS 207.26]
MATSTPNRIPSTPPPAAPRARARKPSAKVLETQQALRTRTTAAQLRQPRTRATASQPHAEAPSSTQQLADHELPPFPTERDSISLEREGGRAKLDKVVQLIASLKETIAQQSSIITNQNSIIESIRTDLTAIKAEQQYLKN